MSASSACVFLSDCLFNFSRELNLLLGGLNKIMTKTEKKIKAIIIGIIMTKADENKQHKSSSIHPSSHLSIPPAHCLMQGERCRDIPSPSSSELDRLGAE